MKNIFRAMVLGMLLSSGCSVAFAAAEKKSEFTLPFNLSGLKAPGGELLATFTSGIEELAMNYYYYDADLKNAGNIFKVDKTLADRLRSGDFQALAGVFVFLAGGIGMLIFGVILLIRMFETGELWGLAYLAGGAAQFATGRVDPSLLAYVKVIAVMLNLYFIVSHWEDARKPVVMQLFSINAMLLGAFILNLP